MNTNKRKCYFEKRIAPLASCQHKQAHAAISLWHDHYLAMLTLYIDFYLRSFCVMHIDVRMPQTQDALARRICVLFFFFSRQKHHAL